MKMLFLTLAICCAAMASQPSLIADIDLLPFDSSNCRFLGNWPFGPSYTVAFDEARLGLINWHRRRYCPKGFRPPYAV